MTGPVSALRRFSRWYVRSIKSYTQPPVVSFDAERVRIVNALEVDFGFAWDEVRRIGYRTLNSAGDDHFLEFHLADGQAVRIVPGWPGAMALLEHVDHLPDTRIDPERGHLANVTDNDSIIIWPSRDAGGSLDG